MSTSNRRAGMPATRRCTHCPHNTFWQAGNRPTSFATDERVRRKRQERDEVHVCRHMDAGQTPIGRVHRHRARIPAVRWWQPVWPHPRSPIGAAFAANAQHGLARRPKQHRAIARTGLAFVGRKNGRRRWPLVGRMSKQGFLALCGVVAGATLLACNVTTACDASNCVGGCCTSDGECISGATTAACGTSGRLCMQCGVGQTCRADIGFVCAAPGGAGEGGGSGGGSGGGIGDPSCKTTLPKSQGLSAPCCQAWGIDACGAQLFCAAFDGRTQPTCYPLGSRADQAECTANEQCSSNECNLTVHRCRSAMYRPCTRDVGCANGAFCPAGTCTAGSLGDACSTRTDCKSFLACRNDACATPVAPGSRCVADGDCLQAQLPDGGVAPQTCASGFCAFESGGNCITVGNNSWTCITGTCTVAGTGFCGEKPSVSCTTGSDCATKNAGFECYRAGLCR